MYFIKLNPHLNIKFVSIHQLGVPQWISRRKLLQDYDMLIVLDSEARLQLNNEEVVLSGAEGFLAAPGETVLVNCPQPEKGSVYAIHFETGAAESGEAFEFPRRMAADTGRIRPLIDEMLDEIKYRQPHMQLRLNCLTTELMIQLKRSTDDVKKSVTGGRRGTAAGAYVRQIIDYLHGNYSRKTTGKEIAAGVSLHYDYANRLFQEQMGCTIMEYLTALRISRARELLANTSMTVDEIAALVGYQDAHYFMKVFKSHEGETAGAYRKRQQPYVLY